MTNSTPSLSNLAQQLALKQSELEQLRCAYETQLADLQRRKQELAAALQDVEVEIQQATQSGSPIAVAPSVLPAAPAVQVLAVTAAPKPEPQAVPATAPVVPEAQPALPQVLLSIVQELARPLTVKELTDEVARRHYSSSSANPAKMVRNSLDKLVQKGRLTRRPSARGVVLSLHKVAATASSAKTPSTRKPAANGAAATKGSPAKPIPARKPAVPGPVAKNGSAASPAPQPKKQTLRAVLMELLEKSDRPLPAHDLAALALAAGYQTRSKTFIDVVWTSLAQLDNVENVAGQGYRLKRRAAKAK